MLMDFQNDYSVRRDRKREVIDIKAKHNEIREDRRRRGKTDQIYERIHQLRMHILEVLDLLVDEYNPPGESLPVEGTPTPVEEEIPRSDETYSNDRVDRISLPKTPYEQEQEKYFTQAEQPTTTTVFEGLGISKAFSSGSIDFILHPIDLKLKLGEITAVVGENGSGKTTLLRIIAGELGHTAGELGYPRLTARGKPHDYLVKQQIAYISQELPKMYGLLADNLHFTAAINGVTGQDYVWEDDPPIPLDIKAGNGGDAEAQGGDGGDCDQCPGGAGGDGGDAIAEGGMGGKASEKENVIGEGSIERELGTGGTGGDADALGGAGGHGADCCKRTGGNGGDGGRAEATAGEAGAPNGEPGTTGVRGGHGGDGGEGEQPGQGGSGGEGIGSPSDIPDGQPGRPGSLCPLPEDARYHYPDHSDVPAGNTEPGTTLTLTTYPTTTTTISPSGAIQLYFLTAEELGLGPSQPPPSYSSDGGGTVEVVGGMQYLSFLWDVVKAIVFLNHECADHWLLWKVYRNGEVVGSGFNQDTWSPSAPPVEERLDLRADNDGPIERFELRIAPETPGCPWTLERWSVKIDDP